MEQENGKEKKNKLHNAESHATHLRFSHYFIVNYRCNCIPELEQCVSFNVNPTGTHSALLSRLTLQYRFASASVNDSAMLCKHELRVTSSVVFFKLVAARCLNGSEFGLKLSDTTLVFLV